MPTNPPFPPTRPFPESRFDSSGGGPDFPGSAGDREQGKFRPSAIPRLVQVAVVDDDGRPVGTALVPNFDELIYWIRAMYMGLVAKGLAEDVTDGLLADDL